MTGDLMKAAPKPSLLLITTMDPAKCIPANPDISGIGVRIAIYAQNLLCFLPIIFYLYDGEISLDELSGIQDQSIGVLAIAFAILITTASLAAGRNATITNYHAAIILDLSWMNNTSTWIWFILYVYSRSTAKYKPVGATWSAWLTAMWSPVRIYLHGGDPPGSHESVTGTSTPSQGREGGRKTQTRLQKVVERLWNSSPIRLVRRVCKPVWQNKLMIYLRRFSRLILAAPVLMVGSLHLSLMAAIGIWLWHDPAGFGLPIDHCTPMLTIFGASVSFKSTPLRIFSLTMYSLLLIPGLNLLPPFTFFLFLHISYNYVRTRIHIVSGRKDSQKGKEREVRIQPAIFIKSLSFCLGSRIWKSSFNSCGRPCWYCISLCWPFLPRSRQYLLHCRHRADASTQQG